MKIRNSRPLLPPVEPGSYFAVCIGVVDLGEQENNYNGKTRYSDQVRFIFELPDVLCEIDGEKKPRQLSRDFTQTHAQTGNLRQFLGAWYGKNFSDDDMAEWDSDEVLGKPAMLAVVLSANGKYANISSASALPKGVPVPVAQSEYLTFDFAHWDDEKFAKLPEYLQKKIMNSTQYKSAHMPVEEVSVEAATAAASQAAEAEGGNPDGGVPF